MVEDNIVMPRNLELITTIWSSAELRTKRESEVSEMTFYQTDLKMDGVHEDYHELRVSLEAPQQSFVRSATSYFHCAEPVQEVAGAKVSCEKT